MSETAVVYGYKLGGPRKWNLTGFTAGDELIVSWYDERNAIHDFPECAVREIITGGRPITDRKVLAAREAALPFWFDEAIELSPPDWIRGRDWDPNPVSMLPVDAPARQLDRPALSEYVLYVHDSFQEIEYEPCYDDPDGELPGEGAGLDFRIDWDSLLDGALAELGLRAPRIPDWFWYRRPSAPAWA